MVIHAASLVAVQAQPAAAVTATVPDPPAAVIVCPAGAIDDAHVDGPAACSIVTARPATVSVPDRAAPVLRSTVNARLPLPLHAPDGRESDPTCAARGGPGAAAGAHDGNRIRASISADLDVERCNGEATRRRTLIDVDVLIFDGQGTPACRRVRVGRHSKTELTGALSGCRRRHDDPRHAGTRRSTCTRAPW